MNRGRNRHTVTHRVHDDDACKDVTPRCLTPQRGDHTAGEAAALARATAGVGVTATEAVIPTVPLCCAALRPQPCTPPAAAAAATAAAERVIVVYVATVHLLAAATIVTHSPVVTASLLLKDQIFFPK